MSFITRCVSVLALAALMPLAPLSAQQRGVGPWRPVKDDIKFFGAPAKERADSQIADLKKTYNKDLYIEAAHAPKRPADVRVDDKAAVDKFFDQYAAKRFDDLHLNGVGIFIIDNPHVLRVRVGNHTQEEGYFTDANRDALIDKIKAHLNKNDHDGALTTATSYVVDTMKANHPVVNRKVGHGGAVVEPGHAAPASPGFRWGSILTILAIVVVIWIVFAVIRGLFANRSGYGGPGMGYGGGGPGYGGGGGGGFFSNMLGGMFGAAAGMWMYNNFFGGHGGSSAWASGPTDAGDKTYPDSGPSDTSSTGAGSDYGADNGGGDWGGDGGGNAGGGDAGGGGDWGGGGGGDWGGGGGGDFGGGGGGDWGGGGGGGDW